MSVPTSQEPEIADVEAARRRIAAFARPTPLMPSPALAERTGAPVFLKLENLQATGSFKVRGISNKLLSLPPEVRARGIVVCSSGNHGLATAYVASLTGTPATVCVPSWVEPLKLERIRRLGAEAVVDGDTYDEAEDRAREIAAARSATFVDPFDDPQVLAGQGTIGLEIAERLPEVATVLVPLSGGGLISGIALALGARRPAVRVIAAYAERARVMVESLAAGRPLELPEEETLATALAGGIGRDNRFTFRLVGELVESFAAVSEEEIARAMAFAFEEHRLVVEGGGAVAVAALLASKVSSPGPLAAVVSGGNIDLGRLAAIVESAR